VFLASQSHSYTSGTTGAARRFHRYSQSLQPIATARYVASREDGPNCSLALFGNFS
jgi:hypothetical protein